MSNKDKDKDELNEQEPWNQPIYEDQVETEDDGDSRADRRVKEEGKNWYVIVLVVLLFLIVLVPVSAILYLNMNNKMNKGETKPTTVVVESSSKEKKKTSETKTSSSSTSSSSSSTESSSSSTSSSSSFADVEVSPNEAQNNQANQNNGAEDVNQNQQQAAPGTTVNYGEGDSTRSLWKIATDNGMTVDELYQLNPGIDSQNVQPGQAIRIK